MFKINCDECAHENVCLYAKKVKDIKEKYYKELDAPFKMDICCIEYTNIKGYIKNINKGYIKDINKSNITDTNKKTDIDKGNAENNGLTISSVCLLCSFNSYNNVCTKPKDFIGATQCGFWC